MVIEKMIEEAILAYIKSTPGFAGVLIYNLRETPIFLDVSIC